jgi:hypothetical protein
MVCNNGTCGVAQCKLDGFPCMGANECCTKVCQNGLCGAGTCLPPGSNCVNTPECCVGLVCASGHCGMAVDAGMCGLDPGGTPCSQCIVGSCCNETESCLMDSQCASAMACFQSCTLGGKTATVCEQMCCTDAPCNTWTACVAADCAFCL